MTVNNTRKILQCVDILPLYLHAYASHSNTWLERVSPADLLNIAGESNLRDIRTHVLDGERLSLGNMDGKELSTFEDKARRLNLDIHIGTGASDKAFIDEAVTIALKTGAPSVCFHSRYEGNLRGVLPIITDDITYVRETHQDSSLTSTIEQHEDLESHGLVSLVKEGEMESLSSLFDFANMIDTDKHPIDALKTMVSRITQVHVKDALIIKEPGDPSHKAYTSSQGDTLPKASLAHLICLGNDESQVTIYSLEEGVDCYAPALRFEGGDDSPWISYRQMGKTPLPESRLPDTRLRKEKEDAINQVNHVRNVLQ